MKKSLLKLSAGLLFLLFLAGVSSGLSYFPDSGKSEEAVRPGPGNVKESVGVYVFVGWIWILILVLSLFLVWKIREADRLYRLGFPESSGMDKKRK